MHVVYGGAHLFKADAASKLGAVALRTLQEHAAPGTILCSDTTVRPKPPWRERKEA